MLDLRSDNRSRARNRIRTDVCNAQESHLRNRVATAESMNVLLATFFLCASVATQRCAGFAIHDGEPAASVPCHEGRGSAQAGLDSTCGFGKKRVYQTSECACKNYCKQFTTKTTRAYPDSTKPGGKRYYTSTCSIAWTWGGGKPNGGGTINGGRGVGRYNCVCIGKQMSGSQPRAPDTSSHGQKFFYGYIDPGSSRPLPLLPSLPAGSHGSLTACDLLSAAQVTDANAMARTSQSRPRP